MLTTDQLAAIDRHLRKDNWLLNEDLIAELTDHYANAITEAMEQGQSFDNALVGIHQSFGGRRGLLTMEDAFIKNSYTAAWLAVKQAARLLLLSPYVLLIGLVAYGIHTVLSTYQLNGFLALIAVHSIFFTLIGLPFFTKLNWWAGPASQLKRKRSGIERVSNIVLSIALNIPINWLAISINSDYTPAMTLGTTLLFTLALIGYLLVAIISFSRNPILQYLTSKR
ncbi:hypothetical protein [Arsenicibacter rosenii]|uniref:Uncharacterized protein n=1 Tax=Arsenicibacter rosenii TaxID=1750698 RepID=A0A1S2VPR1_9BACT|nr:hypothetical protein [Arsenicibacter rosenii]OIN60176.1 hypothetical protein BLX24_04890 [Arsenicibacter rosenii]